MATYTDRVAAGAYADRVAAGIELLDSRKPGWRSKINVDGLDLASCDVCVLGQVFGSYDTGRDILDIDAAQAYDYGFNTHYSFPELTKAWRDALGKNNVLVEKGDVYRDKYGYAVKVVSTVLVPVDDDTITAYIVLPGSCPKSTNAFKAYDDKSISVLRKSDFETDYMERVEKFRPKKGMFVTATSSGRNFYMVSDDEVREIRDLALAMWLTDLPKAERESLKEMMTGVGKKFSDTIVE